MAFRAVARPPANAASVPGRQQSRPPAAAPAPTDASQTKRPSSGPPAAGPRKRRSRGRNDQLDRALARAIVERVHERVATSGAGPSLQRKGADIAASPTAITRAGEQLLQRATWWNWGTEAYTRVGGQYLEMTVWTTDRKEWAKYLDNLDDFDEYWENVAGLLQVCNHPAIASRRSLSSSWDYYNDIVGVPEKEDQVEFLAALYEKGGTLDLWHGDWNDWDGSGAWVKQADKELSLFIRRNQGLYLATLGEAGADMENLEAVAMQGGYSTVKAMVANAGVTVFKALDLLLAAETEGEKSMATQLVRNSSLTIHAALKANAARVSLEQSVINAVFDNVWGTLPGGGMVLEAGKTMLKSLVTTAMQGGPGGEPAAQAKKIWLNFQEAANKLTQTPKDNGKPLAKRTLSNADAQSAINAFSLPSFA